MNNPSHDDSRCREIISSIVKRFARLTGMQTALSIAHRIPHLLLDDDGNVIDYNKDDPLGIIAMLIEQYGSVFGDVAVTLTEQTARPNAETSEDNILREALQEARQLSSMTIAPIKILLVDDHVIFREGLVSLLAPQPDMKVVGQAGSVYEAFALARELKPNVVIMDFSLPDGTGIEATQAILAELPKTKIMFLTMHSDDARLFAALRAGAVGFSCKNVRATELLKQVRGIAHGEAGISGSTALRVLEEFSRLPSPLPFSARTLESNAVTPREAEIIQELAQGATNREIAQRFVISESTVKNHVHSVLVKLNLHSRRDLIDYLHARGLHQSITGFIATAYATGLAYFLDVFSSLEVLGDLWQ